MLAQVKNRKQEGFTIIEVLIVLAIAGLIMLVVFLAVPALQRNSRNNQYRTEANSLATAYGEISANKGGGTLTASVSATASSDAARVLAAANSKVVTRFEVAPNSATAIAEGAAAGPNTVNLTSALARTGAKCTAPDSGVAAAGTTRQIALYFVVETAGGGTQLQCQEV